MEAVFRALADPVRRAILEELDDRNDQTLFQLCGRLITVRGMAMSRQAVAKHVAVLRDAGLVELSSSGRTTIHHLDRTALAEARRWIDRIAHGRGPA